MLTGIFGRTSSAVAQKASSKVFGNPPLHFFVGHGLEGRKPGLLLIGRLAVYQITPRAPHDRFFWHESLLSMQK
jgi:hypothetical protein